MKLTLNKYPEAEVLHQVMPDFDFNNPVADINEIKASMIEIMTANRGIGLAANQVGINARIIVMGDGDNVDILINPVIIDKSSGDESHWEGCLSFPGIYVPVSRANWVEVKYQDINGIEQVHELQGYDAKVLQHEIDHLDGITFNRRVSGLQWNRARKKKHKLFDK